MNELIHICRSVAHSENAINRLNKSIARMGKCCRIINARVTCVAVAGLLITAVVAMQDKEIKALKKQVADLEAARGPMENVADDTMEEQTEQKGA